MITNDLITKMTEFNTGDPKRIQHFIKVYQFAHLIGSKEGLDEEKLKEMLTTANAAASLITRVKGALRVMPQLADVEALVRTRG